MSVLIFLLVLFVLVLVHELGHFVVAKWAGMRVDEFGIGFPPKLFGVRKGETEYTFNLFPIGGFVKIFGEDGVGDPSARPASDFSEGSEGKSQAGVQPRYEEDAKNRAFTSKNKWAQAAVLIAGVTMNVLFAWFLVALAFSTGVDSAVTEAEAGPEARLTVTNVLPESPAAEAGLVPGAVVESIAVDGDVLPVPTPSSFSNFVENHAGESLTLVYQVGGEVRIAQVSPKTGLIESESERPAIGVALTFVERVERSLPLAIKDSFFYTMGALRDITVGIIGFLRDAVLFRANFSEVAGPVGIVGLVGEASTYGLTALLMFTAFISLNLAVINILPFPALDGGRLLFVGIEALKGSPIPARYAVLLNTVGFFLLILLMLVVTWNDIARLI